MLSHEFLPTGTDSFGLVDRSCLELALGTDLSLDRAFLICYLLTGDTQAAEVAVMLAIDSWTPESDPRQSLFQRILETAARTSMEQKCFAPSYHVPPELQNLLKLAAPLRRSFVLRFLLGLPLEVCAELLNVDSHLVDMHLRYAVTRLGKGVPV